MYQEFEDYIREKVKIDKSTLDEILSVFKPLKTQRKQMLCNEGQICKHF